MKRNAVYVLILLLLVGVTYVLFFREAAPDFSISEANFTVKHPEDIQTILLTDLEGNKIKLSKKNQEWKLNDSLDVIASKVHDLLEALHDQRPLEPVVLGSHDHVIKAMSTDHTKVEVYTADGKTNTFYVARITAPNNLTYMLTEGAQRPYIVKLPLQNEFLGLRYTTNLADWRSKKIMKAKADEIEVIDIAYKDSTQYSFHLNAELNKAPLVSGNYSIQKPFNQKRAQSYLHAWDSLYCLGYESRNRLKDTLLDPAHEVATITLKKHGGMIQTLTIYFKPMSKGTKGVLKVGKEYFDFDVYIGLLNKQDMIVIPRRFAQIMLRTYPEFFEADDPKTSNPS